MKRIVDIPDSPEKDKAVADMAFLLDSSIKGLRAKFPEMEREEAFGIAFNRMEKFLKDEGRSLVGLHPKIGNLLRLIGVPGDPVQFDIGAAAKGDAPTAPIASAPDVSGSAGTAMVDVIKADGTEASMPANRVDAARTAGAIK